MTVYQPTKKKTALTYETIIRDVRGGDIKPVYYLMGEEGYYIDRVADFIVATLLQPEERDFNLITLFGAETNIETVINSAKGFPMGAQHLVVVVKEAQNLSGLERLEFYLRNPQPSTVLLFCHKNGALDRRKKIATLIEKAGVLYESKKLYDSQLPAFIRDYLKRKRLAVDPVAADVLASYVGADLSRLSGELDKLVLSLSSGEKTVTLALVESNIGISKDFNIFELQDALVQKDVLKVNRIANYFDKNPKINPIQKTLPALFRFYSQLMLAYYAPEKTERGIAAWLGLTDWQVRKNIMPAMQRYTGTKVMKIIGEIRRTDARSKGVGNPGTANGELMNGTFIFYASLILRYRNRKRTGRRFVKNLRPVLFRLSC